MTPAWSTLGDMLGYRAGTDPELGFTFVDHDGGLDQRSYRQIDRQARAIAAELAPVTPPGSRAILAFPPGLDFITAFFGTLYAGLVAVPVYPPTGERLALWLEVFEHIIGDARPELVLTTTELARAKDEAGLALGPSYLRWVDVATIPDAAADDWSRPHVSEDDVAFIQYTSGSTAAPKGVPLRHANVLANQLLIEAGFGFTARNEGVSWLPMYHDMGLIGCVLQPIHLGTRSTFLSPLTLLKDPLRWLRTVSTARSAASGGPNFAFDLCVKRTTEEQRAALDLSSWEVAYTGAEPVRPDTLRRFAEAFAVSGFDPKAFSPCYGLAEATVFVTAKRSGTPLVSACFDQEELERGHARLADDGAEIVSVGHAGEGHELVVVDVATLTPVAEREIGEIWTRGPSIAEGYWRCSEADAVAFTGRLADGTGPFLRTGDLGFLHDGHLYVTGRSKEVLIIRGRNIHPQDVEDAAQLADPRLRRGGGVVFGDEADTKLSLVQETAVTDPAVLRELCAAARDAVASRLDLALSRVVLVGPREVPKTSSGKLRRSTCKAMWESGELAPVFVDDTGPP